MVQELSGKYFVSTDGTNWEDVTTKWNGVKFLSVGGFGERGDAVNVYAEQWTTSQTEDFMVTSSDGKVIRKNVDLSLTIIVSRRYASGVIDEQSVYDSVVSYICDNGSFYIKSMYAGKYVKVASLKAFKPTDTKLNRGMKSYILAVIPLHVVDVISNASQGVYTPVALPVGNPKQLGYYERNGSDNEYRLTWDTSVVTGKTYYTLS